MTSEEASSCPISPVRREENPHMKMLLQRNLKSVHAGRAGIRTSAKPGVHSIDGLACLEGLVQDVDAFLDFRQHGWIFGHICLDSVSAL